MSIKQKGSAGELEIPDVEVIFCYTRAEALADGVLVDVSKMAREAGFSYPVAVTRGVWERYVVVPEGVTGQDETGRLWDILFMTRWAAKRSNGQSSIRVDLVIRNTDDREPAPVTLKAVCHPGDNAEPVITIMLPEED